MVGPSSNRTDIFRLCRNANRFDPMTLANPNQSKTNLDRFGSDLCLLREAKKEKRDGGVNLFTDEIYGGILGDGAGGSRLWSDEIVAPVAVEISEGEGKNKRGQGRGGERERDGVKEERARARMREG